MMHSDLQSAKNNIEKLVLILILMDDALRRKQYERISDINLS